jgi:hypothetical protein
MQIDRRPMALPYPCRRRLEVSQEDTLGHNDVQRDNQEERPAKKRAA